MGRREFFLAERKTQLLDDNELRPGQLEIRQLLPGLIAGRVLIEDTRGTVQPSGIAAS